MLVQALISGQSMDMSVVQIGPDMQTMVPPRLVALLSAHLDKSRAMAVTRKDHHARGLTRKPPSFFFFSSFPVYYARVKIRSGRRLNARMVCVLQTDEKQQQYSLQ